MLKVDVVALASSLLLDEVGEKFRRVRPGVRLEVVQAQRDDQGFAVDPVLVGLPGGCGDTWSLGSRSGAGSLGSRCGPGSLGSRCGGDT